MLCNKKSTNNFVHKKKVKLVYKPSSVLDDHLSRRFVAKPLMRFWERASSSIAPHLAPRRVYSRTVSPQCGVCSYHAFPPLPFAVIYTHNQLAVYLCCPFPQVTLDWRYQLRLLFGARTFLTFSGAIIWLTLR